MYMYYISINKQLSTFRKINLLHKNINYLMYPIPLRQKQNFNVYYFKKITKNMVLRKNFVFILTSLSFTPISFV